MNFGNIGTHEGNRQTFDSGAVPVTSTTVWQVIGVIPANGRDVSLTGLVGAGGALGDLKIELASTRGGTPILYANGTKLDAETFSLRAPVHSGASIEATPANGNFYMELKTGAVEITISAKMATVATTLQVLGTIL